MHGQEQGHKGSGHRGGCAVTSTASVRSSQAASTVGVTDTHACWWTSTLLRQITLCTAHTPHAQRHIPPSLSSFYAPQNIWRMDRVAAGIFSFAPKSPRRRPAQLSVSCSDFPYCVTGLGTGSGSPFCSSITRDWARKPA